MSKLLSEKELEAAVSSERSQNRSIVFASGVFDLLHKGHVKYLCEAKEQGDVLVVFVHSDPSVKRMKGTMRPVVDVNDRTDLIAALACVDYICVFDEENPKRLLDKFRPDVMVRSGKPKGEIKEFVEAYGGRAHYVPMVGDVSSTKIMERVRHV